jgi:hypothetical protein
MAKIAANTLLLWLREVGATDFRNVICLTNHGIQLTRGTNDDSTFCGPDSSPGTLSGTIPIAGKTFLMPDTGSVSAPELMDWMIAGTTLEFRQTVAEPTDGDWIIEGQLFLSDFATNYDVDQTGAFTATATLKGDPDSYIVGESSGE